MTVNNTDSEEIAENEKIETPEISSLEMEEAEEPEETACFSLAGETAENISIIGETFNELPQTIVEIAVNDPERYLTMLEAARKLAK